MDEKIKPIKAALRQINVEQVARETGVPSSALRYDLAKLEVVLPQVLANQIPGPKWVEPDSALVVSGEIAEESRVYPKCGARLGGMGGIGC